MYLANDVIDPETGEIIVEQGQAFTEDNLNSLKNLKRLNLHLITSSGYVLQPTIAIDAYTRSMRIRKKKH